MSAATNATTEPVHPPTAPDREADRYAGIEQYSLKEIIAVWAAAAVPMGVLAWVVAPLLKDQFSGPEPLIPSALVCITAALVWQFVLVLILLRQEIGSFEWPRVRALAWIVAVVAAAIAYRQVGAPLLATILLALSFMVVSHPPPIGPIGLLCFASAVALLARAQHVSSRLRTAAPAPIPT